MVPLADAALSLVDELILPPPPAEAGRSALSNSGSPGAASTDTTASRSGSCTVKSCISNTAEQRAVPNWHACNQPHERSKAGVREATVVHRLKKHASGLLFSHTEACNNTAAVCDSPSAGVVGGASDGSGRRCRCRRLGEMQGVLCNRSQQELAMRC